MRKTLLLCAIAACLTGCTPSANPVYRAREARPFPDPTEGTDNHESQWYKTQILAAPSAAGSAGAPVSTLPAKAAKTPVQLHGSPTAAPQGAGVMTGTGNPGI